MPTTPPPNPFDDQDANVTILFGGQLMMRNDPINRKVKVGIPFIDKNGQTDDHALEIVISDEPPTGPTKDIILFHGRPLQDIQFNFIADDGYQQLYFFKVAQNPVELDADFQDDPDYEHDIQWLADFANSHYHGQSLYFDDTVFTKYNIFLNAGRFYTHQKQQFIRFQIAAHKQVTNLGVSSVANIIGCKIKVKDDTSTLKCPQFTPPVFNFLADHKYTIIIKNFPPEPNPPVNTTIGKPTALEGDFDSYYYIVKIDAVIPIDFDKQIHLLKIVLPGSLALKANPLSEDVPCVPGGGNLP